MLHDTKWELYISRQPSATETLGLTVGTLKVPLNPRAEQEEVGKALEAGTSSFQQKEN